MVVARLTKPRALVADSVLNVLASWALVYAASTHLQNQPCLTAQALRGLRACTSQASLMASQAAHRLLMDESTVVATCFANAKRGQIQP